VLGDVPLSTVLCCSNGGIATELLRSSEGVIVLSRCNSATPDTSVTLSLSSLALSSLLVVVVVVLVLLLPLILST